MTFWQDAPPATPRFRNPKRPRLSPRWSRPGRRAALVLLAVVVVAIGVGVIRSSGDATAEAVPRHAASHVRAARPQVIPSRWARTLPDWPSLMVRVPGKEGIVIGARHVYSVALTTGRMRWEVPLVDVHRSAAVAGDTILVSRDHGFAALERATGEIRWRTDTAETPSSVALVGPPGAAQVAVVSTREGGLVGLNSRTGEARWSIRLTGMPGGVIAVDQESGALITVWQGEESGARVRVIEGATGALRWERTVALNAGSAVIANGIVVVGSGNRDASTVRGFSLADGTPIWTTPVGAPFQPDLVPLVDDGEVFTVDQMGGVTRLGLADGARRWKTATKALSVFTAPLRVDDTILIGNEAGEVVTLDRATGAIRARRRPAGLPVGLAVAGRFVVVVQRLVRLDAIQAFDADRLVATARSGR